MTQTQTMQTPDATLSHATPTTTDVIRHATATPPTPDATLSHATATPPTPDATLSHATMQTMQSVEFDFDNDDDAFYDFIEFGIASNGGRLSIW